MKVLFTMLVEIKRSNLGSGDWFLRPRGTTDLHIVELPAGFAARIAADAAWFRAEREDGGWRIVRFVAGLVVDNPAPIRPKASDPRSGVHVPAQ